MQAFITEELIWALHRERVQDARQVWLASRVRKESSDDEAWIGGPPRAVPLNPIGPSGLKPAGTH